MVAGEIYTSALFPPFFYPVSSALRFFPGGLARPSTSRLLAITAIPTQRCMPRKPRYRQRRIPWRRFTQESRLKEARQLRKGVHPHGMCVIESFMPLSGTPKHENVLKIGL